MRTRSIGWLATGLALLLFGCSDGPRQQPCDLDCGTNGTCIISAGRPACLCDQGWDGPDCASCAPGYLARAGDCLPEGPDPCDPNPCAAPHRSVCRAVAGQAVCDCDADAQDHDADGTCLPDCRTLTVDFPAQACDDSSGTPELTGLRECQVLVRFDPAGQAFASLYLRGEFNAWDLSAPLVQDSDGHWQARLSLPAGDYAYKFFDPDAQAWFEDPANPFHRWLAGERNSRLRVPDCERPLLVLLGKPDARGQAVTFRVQYLDGSRGAGLSAAGIRVTRNRSSIQAEYDPLRRVLVVADSGLAPGKYAYRFEASDQAGRSAEPLYVPVWIESASFDWRDGLMYFALTDRFADGDPLNNQPAQGVDPRANWQGGDFAGLQRKIESGYFDELGINTLWISSISQNTGGGFAGSDGRMYSAYHSYWPVTSGWRDDAPLSNGVPVDPHFGSLEDFAELVRVAHARGIRVLVDLVLNHVHEESGLWIDHQHDDPTWFHLPAEDCQATDWTKPISCWFAPYLPDLEYKNPAVMDALIEHAAWLVRTTDVDGFRVDAVKHMLDDVVLHLRGRMDQLLRRTGIRFYMVGETFTGEDGAAQLEHYIGPDQLDGQFDFPLYWQVAAVFLREERDLRALARMAADNDTRYGDFAVMSTFLGNHDVCRALSHANGDIGDLWCNGGKEQGWTSPPALPQREEPFARLRLAWTFLLTSPGLPLIYYGDELGLAGAGDPDNRRMMLFEPDLSPLQRQTHELVQRLAAVRRNHPALRRGQRVELHSAADGMTWAYGMRSGHDRVVVVLNRAAQPRSPAVPLAALEISDGSLLFDAIGGGQYQITAGELNLTLAGRSAAVLVQDLP